MKINGLVWFMYRKIEKIQKVFTNFLKGKKKKYA